MRFGDFVGNPQVKKQLAADIDAGRFPHALLLEGEAGSGRRMLAQLVARAAVCRATDGDRPCGRCEACVKSEHPDILMYASESGALTVDTIRALRQEAYVLPNESSYRAIILANAQGMTPQAQNALLKILEEPPRHVLFILTCDNRTQLLETIRSRCVCLTLGPVDWDEARAVLTARLPRVDEEQLHRAHDLFGGCIGRVLDGMQDGTFRQVLELTPLFARALIAPTELEFLRLTARLEKEKELTAGVLAGLALVVRDALMIAHHACAGLSTAPQEAQRLAACLPARQLMELAKQIEALQQAQRRNMNNTLFLARMSACLRQAAELGK